MLPSIKTAEDFQKHFNVDSDVMERLRVYESLLLKWQKTINLISPNTLQTLWSRHFADSAQLLPLFVGGTKTCVDMGSGAGFPACVLAIMNPHLSFTAIESDQRKAQFLKTVSRETGANIAVLNERIENANLGTVPDTITARALASLDVLLGFCAGWAAQNPALEMVFLKGESVEAEVSSAQQKYDFEYKILPSVTHHDGRVLLIKNLCKRSIS